VNARSRLHALRFGTFRGKGAVKICLVTCGAMLFRLFRSIPSLDNGLPGKVHFAIVAATAKMDVGCVHKSLNS
jgi:hypothetical protein